MYSDDSVIVKTLKFLARLSQNTSRTICEISTVLSSLLSLVWCNFERPCTILPRPTSNTRTVQYIYSWMISSLVETSLDRATSRFPAVQNMDSQYGNIRNMTSRTIHRRLYLSHALSTWNSRVFEFGSYLFLATIFPGTLLPASVYALARATAAALLSPWLGSYLDKTDRLVVVRLSISTLTTTQHVIAAR